MKLKSWVNSRVAGFGVLSLMLAASCAVAAPEADSKTPVPVKIVKASASSFDDKNPPEKVFDGVIKENSRWLSKITKENLWIEVELDKEQKLTGLHLYSGFQFESVLESFNVQFWSKDKWQDIPSAKLTNNKSWALVVPFDETVEVVTNKLRINISQTPGNIARVQEIVVWPASVGNLPPLPKSITSIKTFKDIANEPVPLIYLNQTGFNLGKPKRFTAPTLPDGTKFVVKPAKGTEVLFDGVLKNHIGDFSAFNLTDDREYVVTAGEYTSEPFRIGQWWLERVSYQGMINFMVDSRHYLGNYKAKCKGSFGWRDDHHFGWELHTLIPQYLSNPSAYTRMPHQVKYEKPTDEKLWGKLNPCPADAPDIIKLIHWGADVIVTQETTHEMLKSQLAYFLYAWPYLKQYLPQQNYEAVKEFALKHWEDETADRAYPHDESQGHNLLTLKTKIGTTKGAYPPGFTIEPNLLMYEVAKRDGIKDADKFLNAAIKQAEWIIANVDWNDPLTTKGQRMSEFITMTGLAHLQRNYPEHAPKGLVKKINEWADVAIRRANNLWDFRKLDDADKWTPMGEKPTMWNEPGNVLGFPAALIAAQPFLDSDAKKERFEQLIYSHLDNGFGRNPTGRAFWYEAPREIEGVEHGWYSFLAGGIGQLAEARFVIDGSPKDALYPYNPEKGNMGWTEGWVQFNTAFNCSLAYKAWADTNITIKRDGDDLVVRLQAPLNFDYSKVETAAVQITTSAGDIETIAVTEESANSPYLVARIKAQPGAAKSGDGSVQANNTDKVQASYGYGYLGRTATLE